MKQEVEVEKKSIYGSAVKSESARIQLAEAPGLLQAWVDDYSKNFEELKLNVEHYGAISKLEDDSGKFADKLRGSEERLKNDLGGRSFFKKRMDVGKYWDARMLEEFGDFEGVVDTNYKRFVGDVYAKLDKKGDVLVERMRKVGIIEKMWTGNLYAISGVSGIVAGGMVGGIIGRFIIEGVPVELNSSSVVVGAVAGWIGATGLAYSFLRRANTFTNPLSNGADDLEKRVDIIKKALEK